MTNLVEKTQAIVDRLKETNYELFDNSKDEALDFVESRLEAFLKYADIVINDVDTKDRYAVAEYIGQVVNEMYEMNRSC
jgi:hypothetical protein